MEEIKSKKEEKSKRNNKAKVICRETGDHVHYPSTRRTKSKRPHHAPSPNLYAEFKSSFLVTRKVHYGECRKNQAADIGSTAYDGCGEFVIATTGDDSMNCAACGCHRSFHREESLSNEISATTDAVSATVLEVLKISSHQFRQIFCSPYGDGENGVMEENLGQDPIAVDRSGGGDSAEEETGRVKRFKTKFSAEQTEKMRNYAEKLRWKVSPENREEVEEFCIEIGVNPKKFRVWMNNHKDKN